MWSREIGFCIWEQEVERRVGRRGREIQNELSCVMYTYQVHTIHVITAANTDYKHWSKKIKKITGKGPPWALLSFNVPSMWAWHHCLTQAMVLPLESSLRPRGTELQFPSKRDGLQGQVKSIWDNTFLLIKDRGFLGLCEDWKRRKTKMNKLISLLDIKHLLGNLSPSV